MAIINSADGKIIQEYWIEELKEQAALMRGYSLTALCAAGSGHAGGTLSIMDVAAALYLRCRRPRPQKSRTGRCATASSGPAGTKPPRFT